MTSTPSRCITAVVLAPMPPARHRAQATPLNLFPLFPCLKRPGGPGFSVEQMPENICSTVVPNVLIPSTSELDQLLWPIFCAIGSCWLRPTLTTLAANGRLLGDF